MEKLRQYLELKIKGCDELGNMEKEKWAFQQCLIALNDIPPIETPEAEEQQSQVGEEELDKLIFRLVTKLQILFEAERNELSCLSMTKKDLAESVRISERYDGKKAAHIKQLVESVSFHPTPKKVPTVEEIKNQIALKHGYPNDILGNAWDYAMQLTHRTKAQIKLYEELIQALHSLLPDTIQNGEDKYACEHGHVMYISPINKWLCYDCERLFNRIPNVIKSEPTK